MESTAIPLNLTLKVEESEEQIQSPELEDGSTDMQKVRICSEGAWVSQGSGATRLVRNLLPEWTKEGKTAQSSSAVRIPEKTVLWL